MSDEVEVFDYPIVWELAIRKRVTKKADERFFIF